MLNLFDNYRIHIFVECDGFTCPPPYKKCIRHDQRCDGKVDCIGAEDEIDCPIVEDPYYSRSEAQQDESKPMDDITKTITTFLATTPSTPIMDTTDSNDVETTTFKIILPEMPKQFKCKRLVFLFFFSFSLVSIILKMTNFSLFLSS